MKDEKRIQYPLRMPKALSKKLDDYANGLGIPKNALILQILWNYMESTEEEAH